VRLAAPTRNDLEYWMKGIREITKKWGTAFQENVFTAMTNVIQTAPGGITPPLYVGEEIVNVLPFVHLDQAVVLCFLTNFRIHLMRPRPALPESIKGVNLPESQCKQATKHSVPITAIYKAEKIDVEKEKLGIDLYCRDLRRITIKFDSHQQQSTGTDPRNQILHHLSLFTPEKKENIFAYQHYKVCVTEKVPSAKDGVCNNYGYVRYNYEAEFKRLGLPNNYWKISDINKNYELCSSYPAVLCLPQHFENTFIKKVSKFRTRNRIPALSWIHPTNGAVMCRCSQPRRGVTGATNAYDEEYLEFLATQGSNPGRLWVYDARSEAAAIGNLAIGGGFEDGYKNCKVVFCDVENIHAVRGSWKTLMKLCEAGGGDDLVWYNKLQECGWFVLLYRVMLASLRVVASLSAGESVLVHCSDGWDRTAQMTSISTLLLDPYYRTFNGFQLLIEKEWLSFGHQLSLRTGIETMAGDSSSEESPIFLQFLECVYYLKTVFPTAFEFNEDFLIAIFDNLYSACFGTFLCNSEKERLEKQIPTSTVSFWAHIDLNRECYINDWYAPVNEVLVPSVGVGHIQIWRRLWYRWDPIERKARTAKDKKLKALRDEFKSLGGNMAELVKANPSVSNPHNVKFARYAPNDNLQGSGGNDKPGAWSTTNPFLTRSPTSSESEPFWLKSTVNRTHEPVAEGDGDDIPPDFDGDAVEMKLIASNTAEKAAASANTGAQPPASEGQDGTALVEKIRKRKVTLYRVQHQDEVPEPEDIDLTDAAELLEAGGGVSGGEESSSSSDEASDYHSESSETQSTGGEWTGAISFAFDPFGPMDPAPASKPQPATPSSARGARPPVDREPVSRPSGSKRSTTDGEKTGPTPRTTPGFEKRSTTEGDSTPNSARAWPPRRSDPSINEEQVSPTTSPRKPQPPIPTKYKVATPSQQQLNTLTPSKDPTSPRLKTPPPTPPKQWTIPKHLSPKIQLILQEIGPPPPEAVPKPTKK